MVSMSQTFRLAVLPGDGIGPEVTAQALTVLDAIGKRYGVAFERQEYDLGARRYHATGEILPGDVLDEIRETDAILLGAIGDPSVPAGVLERGLLLTGRSEERRVGKEGRPLGGAHQYEKDGKRKNSRRAAEGSQRR